MCTIIFCSCLEPSSFLFPTYFYSTFPLFIGLLVLGVTERRILTLFLTMATILLHLLILLCTVNRNILVYLNPLKKNFMSWAVISNQLHMMRCLMSADNWKGVVWHLNRKKKDLLVHLVFHLCQAVHHLPYHPVKERWGH